MPEREVVYLCGPISLGGSCSEDEIEAFTKVFTDEAERLRSSGREVINPCEFEVQDSWADYMRLGLSAVCQADVVAVLPRFLESRGAMLEVFVARQLGIPIENVEGLR